MKKHSKFPNVTHFTDRHGAVRYRYRKRGVTVALGTDYGSDDFIMRFNAAVKCITKASGQVSGKVPSASNIGILSNVIDSWYKSVAFVRLGSTTQYGYRNVLENLRKLHGNKLIADLHRRHIKDIMAKKADTPNSANHDLRMLRLVLDHAVDLEIIKVNEARGVRKFSVTDTGYHTWTEAEILHFYAAYPLGTTAHTAMTLMLYTGAARADACALGPASIVNGRMTYSRKKMQTRSGVVVSIPIHPALAACIAGIPKENTTFLQTEAGGQRSPNGLGNLMRGWCDKVVLHECSSHGLRKACARRLIEAGATPHEMMAVTGHKTLSEAQRYADTFDRSSAADRAINKQAGG